MSKVNLPTTLTGERIEYQRLYDLTGTQGRNMTTSGAYSFTSLSSGTTYSTSSGGEYAVFLQLESIISNSNVNADNFNNKVEQSDFDTHTNNTTTAHGVGNKLAKSGDTIQNYSETVTTVTSSAGVATFDLSLSNSFAITLTENTTIAITNVPSGTNKCITFVVKIKQGATSKSISFPASMYFSNGQTPDFSAINKTHMLFGTSFDSGVTWICSALTNYAI